MKRDKVGVFGVRLLAHYYKNEESNGSVVGVGRGVVLVPKDTS